MWMSAASLRLAPWTTKDWIEFPVDMDGIYKVADWIRLKAANSGLFIIAAFWTIRRLLCSANMQLLTAFLDFARKRSLFFSCFGEELEPQPEERRRIPFNSKRQLLWRSATRSLMEFRFVPWERKPYLVDGIDLETTFDEEFLFMLDSIAQVLSFDKETSDYGVAVLFLGDATRLYNHHKTRGLYDSIKEEWEKLNQSIPF
jgi:hypothetical protein